MAYSKFEEKGIDNNILTCTYDGFQVVLKIVQQHPNEIHGDWHGVTFKEPHDLRDLVAWLSATADMIAGRRSVDDN